MTAAAIQYFERTDRLTGHEGRHISGEVFDIAAKLKALGITVRVTSDMDEVRAAQRSDGPTYEKGLYPALNPAYMSRHDDRQVLIAYDADGLPVATAGWVRNYIEHSYEAAWESGLLLTTEDAIAANRAAYRFTCSAPIARQIQGYTVGLYGVWTRPDQRAKGLSKLLVRLVYALAYAENKPSWLVGLVWPDLHSDVIWKSYGFRRAEHELSICMPGCVAEGMRLTANTLAELEQFLGVSRAIVNKHADMDARSWG